VSDARTCSKGSGILFEICSLSQKEESLNLIYMMLSYFYVYFSIQYATKKSSNKEDAEDEDADPENMLEKQLDYDMMDRANKAGVGEQHESSDEEVEVR
jgi:hypothetical protein